MSAGDAMHHCSVKPRSAAAACDAALPRLGAPGARAQPAHADEALDQPVVLEGRARPTRRTGRASARKAAASADARACRRSSTASRVAYGDVDARWRQCATSGGSPSARAQRREAVGQDVVARLPAHADPSAARSTPRCRTGAARSCGYNHESSCTAPIGTPRARRSSTAAARAAGDVESGLGAVPVRGTVVGPVRRPSVRARPHSGRAHASSRAPSSAPQRRAGARPVAPRTIASDVVKPAGTSSRSPCQPQAGPFSSAAKHCSCAPSTGASRIVSPSGSMSSTGRAHAGRCGSCGTQRAKVRSVRAGSANSVRPKPQTRRPSGAEDCAGSNLHPAESFVKPPVARPVRSRVARSDDQRHRVVDRLAGRFDAVVRSGPRRGAEPGDVHRVCAFARHRAVRMRSGRARQRRVALRALRL